ncbi:MAG: NUDIX hydrolase [Ignavibacteriales bacterium]|nr:NUDIX hydrolase [Ignavibacteriales bacterium]
MKSKPKYWYNQSAVIPFRKEGDNFEVLIITTRKGKNWTIPKGIIDKDLTPQESALKEAKEEAGISGKISKHKIGNYTYKKWGSKCSVDVFALEVENIYDTWEENNRQRKWVTTIDIDNFIKKKKIIKLVDKLIDYFDKK